MSGGGSQQLSEISNVSAEINHPQIPREQEGRSNRSFPPTPPNWLWSCPNYKDPSQQFCLFILILQALVEATW